MNPPEPAVDLVVIGAGPAGLAGALTAADGGARVVVLDLGGRPGGQYWRHPPPALGGGPTPSHHGWRTFAPLLRRFAAHRDSGAIDYRPGTAVWRLEREEWVTVRATSGERRPQALTVRARAALVATGAYDRHVPFPGWTLPGVVAVGATQALLKENRLPVGRRVVVAGTGPFLLPAAEGLLRAGVEVCAVVEAGRPTAYARAPRAVAAVPEKLVEAAGYLRTLARHRVPYLCGRAVVAAHGAGRVEGVTVRRVDGDWRPRGPARSIACDTLAVGFGFVPQLELLLELGCATHLDRTGTLVTVVDDQQQTSVDGIYAAGEPTGVGGAELALVEGALAGDALVRRLGRPGSLDARARTGAGRRRSRLRAFAALLADAHPVRPGWRGWCEAGTLVCRCEEVTLGEVTEAVALGARDPRSVKLLSRSGMGWCQGRICGAAVACLVGELSGRPLGGGELSALARRPLAQPVPLEVLAQQDPDHAAACGISHGTGPTPVSKSAGGMHMKPWHGVLVATATPYDATLGLDLDRLGAHVAWLAANGCQGVTPNGSLGEYQVLSADERAAVVRTAVEAAPEGFQVIPGVAAYGARESRAWAEQAAEAGAAAVLLLPPNAYRADARAVIAHYEEVGRAGLPIVAYNNPIDTKVDLVPSLLAELYQRGAIVAVKEFSGDVRRAYELAELAPGLDLLVGADDVLLELMLAGAKGWVAGYPNALPVTCVELYEAARDHDLERALPLYRALHPLLRWDSRTEFVQAIKLSMDMAGGHGGACRPPRQPLSPDQEAVVRAATQAVLDAGYR